MSSFPTIRSIDSGDNVTLEAVPAPGYVFSKWSGDMSGETNPAVILIDCTKSVRANFSTITYPLTIRINGGGSTVPAAGTSKYAKDQKVTIIATPARGWQFDGWSGDVADHSSFETTVIMDTAKTVIARFVKTMSTLTINTNGSGSTVPKAGSYYQTVGSVINIEAIPDSGWQFDSWSGDVADPKSAITTVTMASDKTILANFSQKTPPYIIAAAAIGGIILLSILVIFIKKQSTS